MLNAAEGDVASQPMCPQHPEREAVRTCARCGRYACASCEGGDGRCRECTRLSALEVPDSRARARRATVTQYVSGGASLLGLLFNLLLLPELKGERLSLAANGMLILGGSVTIAALVCFLMWVHRVVRQLKALGEDIGMSPARAVWMWLIPLVNWVKPYHVMRDIAERLGGMSFVAVLPLQLWWGVNVAARILERVESRMLAGKPGEVDPTTAEMVGLVSSVCAVAVAYLSVQLIKEVQVRLDQRRQGLYEQEAPVSEDVATAA
ncbi:DUF4328 domain-containing protein [Corallococcus macrosporus]|uniref:DUF4328 domain-containing protein n=1 Tax=Corallococcus macrosporus TaxID=35 RepID=A0ABS3DPR8_9BACT|nr:DUF4328 domain-containing protein [Corallococcus macrosporus]MBN8233326.1 DUF4328 domain-containing protein [Corallococcus macrosporus]